ncbi:hypothetical protein DENIT_130138 [Pseudomonas veronii]|nr:hypothetical protein DENIT_130138 [Pseudomonas veronii]
MNRYLFLTGQNLCLEDKQRQRGDVTFWCEGRWIAHINGTDGYICVYIFTLGTKQMWEGACSPSHMVDCVSV